MSGLIWIQSDTQMVFLKEFSKKDDFEKNQQTTKKHKKFPRGGGMGGGGQGVKKSMPEPSHTSLTPTKPVFGVSDTVIFKPTCSATETSLKIEI